MLGYYNLICAFGVGLGVGLGDFGATNE